LSRNRHPCKSDALERATLLKTPGSERVRVTDLIEIAWENGRVRIYVNNEPFMFCSFLLVDVARNDPRNETVTVEELAQRPGAKALEGREAVGFHDDDGNVLSKDDIMWGFASSIHGWYIHDYNTAALHANLSFPLLKAVARAGDAKARRVLQGEIHDRILMGHRGAIPFILDSCADVIDEEDFRLLINTWHDDQVLMSDLFASEDLPKELVRIAMRDPRVHYDDTVGYRINFLRAMSPASADELVGLMDDMSPEMRQSVIHEISKFNRWSHDVSKAINKAATNDGDFHVREEAIRVCKDPDVLDTIVETWIPLVDPTTVGLLAAVAHNARAKPSTLLKLLSLNDPYRQRVLDVLCYNPSIDPDLVDKLVETKLPSVLRALYDRKMLARSLPDARRITYFRRLHVKVDDVASASSPWPYQLIMGEQEFSAVIRAFSSLKGLNDFLKLVGLTASVEPRGIGHRRKVYDVQGSYKQVEMAWTPGRIQEYRRKNNLNRCRICVRAIFGRLYSVHAPDNEDLEMKRNDVTSILVPAACRPGLIVHMSHTMAMWINNAPPKAAVVKAVDQVAHEPPSWAYSVYDWKGKRQNPYN